MPVATPLINGRYPSFADVEISARERVILGCKAFAYKHKVEIGKPRGTGPQVLGTTTGDYEGEGSLELYLRFAVDLRAALGPGYMAVPFNIVVNWSDVDGGGIITDRATGCRIIGEDNDHSQGTDAATVKLELYIQKLQLAGLDPLPNMR